jgi:glycosyltransferase involved in cell wall biosynthesis
MISVIVPCRNEEGNVPYLIRSLSDLSMASEVIFVEGGSSDKTFESLKSAIHDQQSTSLRVIKQEGVGKFNAVLEGVAVATYEFIAIWDGDNTIDSKDQDTLMRDFLKSDPLTSFVTANRINPQRDKNAFRAINIIGNKFFSVLVNVVFKEKLPDVLAGTKIFPKYILDEDFGCLDARRLDPFGDLYLIAMASRAKLNIRYLDCHYQERFYGRTNIKRWSGGLALLNSIMHYSLHKCASSHKNRD